MASLTTEILDSIVQGGEEKKGDWAMLFQSFAEMSRDKEKPSFGMDNQCFKLTLSRKMAGLFLA